LTRGIRSGCSDNKAMKAMRRRIALSRSLGTLCAKSMPTRFRFCVSFWSAHAFSHLWPEHSSVNNSMQIIHRILLISTGSDVLLDLYSAL
jgi:hypothetical protein